MKRHLDISLAIASFVICGCASQSPELSEGIYRWTTSLHKPNVEHDYGGVIERRVILKGENISIVPLGGTTNGWYEGKIIKDKITFSPYFTNPIPGLERYNLIENWEGTIVAKDKAEGTMDTFTGTNVFMTGSWSLIKIR